MIDEYDDAKVKKFKDEKKTQTEIQISLKNIESNRMILNKEENHKEKIDIESKIPKNKFENDQSGTTSNRRLNEFHLKLIASIVFFY